MSANRQWSKVLQAAFPVWQRWEAEEAAACRNCPGIQRCPNQERATTQVIRYYKDGQPYLAMKRCEKNKPREQQMEEGDAKQ